MISMGFSMQLTVAVFFGFVFYVACHDINKQCFEVESRTICYFMPNVSSVDWATAWKTCKELDATLPVIPNEKGQTMIGDYLSRSKYFSGKQVWTAGRYIGTDNEWKWLNGQNFTGTEQYLTVGESTIRHLAYLGARDCYFLQFSRPYIVYRVTEGHKPSCPRDKPDCPHETQAVVTKDRKYGARYPSHMHPFICSYPDTSIKCRNESQTFKQWKGGCLSWKPNHRLRLDEARNECLKGGGDLATFSEDGDLQELSSVIKNYDTEEYWIGLQRKWWIWNTTDLQDVKYNLLGDHGAQAKECLFIDDRGLWSQDKCSVNKNVICETAKERILSEISNIAAYVAIGIVIAVLVVAIIVVVLLIFIRRRLRIAESKPIATTSDPVTPSHKAIVQCTDDTYATIDDDDFENVNHKNNPNPYNDRLGNLSAESKPNITNPVTPSHKTIVQSTDDTYATIDVDDDVENLNYQNGPNPSTAYTNIELCNDPSAEYSELNDFGASATERSTNVYADPYVNSSVTAVSRTPAAVGSPSDIYSEVNKPRLGKKSDELTSPPIKIGPHGDIYTLPISPK